jgi:hypothetical protein
MPGTIAAAVPGTNFPRCEIAGGSSTVWPARPGRASFGNVLGMWRGGRIHRPARVPLPYIIFTLPLGGLVNLC